jgi:CheY-like chemotaxis protein
VSDRRLEHAIAAFLRQEFGAPVAAIIGFIDILIEDARRHDLADFVPDLERMREAGVQQALGDDRRERESALALVSAEGFDLVLLDLMMPGMSGFEVLCRLKADEGTRHIPVIMISALDELDSTVRCVDQPLFFERRADARAQPGRD